jgi:hypothetical protein
MLGTGVREEEEGRRVVDENMIGEHLDSELINRLKEALDNESLVQLILHAHLLIERAITLQIEDKLGKPCRGKFCKKLDSYVGLMNPPTDRKQKLLAFNKLRNKIAHGFEDDARFVWDCLPWKGEQEARPDTRTYVLLEALSLLLDLGAIDCHQNSTEKLYPLHFHSQSG